MFWHCEREIQCIEHLISRMLFTQSLVSSLHTVIQGVSITGQTGSKSALEKNAGVFLNPEQPLVQVSYFSCLVVNKLFCKTQSQSNRFLLSTGQGLVISESDIRKQEERVLSARVKLQEALRSL